MRLNFVRCMQSHEKMMSFWRKICIEEIDKLRETQKTQEFYQLELATLAEGVGLSKLMTFGILSLPHST